jgi:hypothetical protein
VREDKDRLRVDAMPGFGGRLVGVWGFVDGGVETTEDGMAKELLRRSVGGSEW